MSLGFQLSLQQRRLYRLLQQDRRPHSVTVRIAVGGSLDPALLERALQSLVDRYEILRTTFIGPSGEDLPHQVVHDSARTAFASHDLTALAGAEQEARIAELLDGAMAGPPDGGSPTLCASLLRLSPNRHLLELTLPALCTDVAGLSSLVERLGAAYAQCASTGGVDGGGVGEQEPLQYADIAAWQDELLVASETEPGRAFWRLQRIPDPSGMELPYERDRTATRFLPGRIASRLDGERGERLERAIEATGASLSSYLLACWRVLLWRLSRGAVTVVGVGCDGRQFDELEGALGLLCRYLPLHGALNPRKSMREVLIDVHSSVADMARWQAFFSWELIAHAGPSDPLARSFPYAFDYLELPAVTARAGATFELKGHDLFVDRFAARLSCTRTSDGIDTTLHFDAATLRSVDMERLLGHYHALVASSARDLDSRIVELDLLTGPEREQFDDYARADGPDYPRGGGIHELIEQTANGAPDAVAVETLEGRLTYSELDERANQLARYLAAKGVGPGAFVGLCVERSLDMVVAILGVLKAGAAYVPLDPDYPQERLGFLLQDSGVAIVLTHDRLLSRLDGCHAEVVCLDADAAVIASEKRSKPGVAVQANDPVYVIYTSGTTGQPKGVVITHEGLVISNAARIDYFRAPVGKFLLLSPLAFDSSVVGVFWTLLTGGTLLLVPTASQQNPERLVQLIAEHQVTHLLTLPTFYDLLLEQADGGLLDSVRTAIVAGEPCPKRLVDRHEALLPGTNLHSEYGATETTVWASVYDCRGQRLATAPLGEAIGHSRLYLLDPYLQPVPIGVPGEVYFGGPGLALGYCKRPGLTAERFIPDPFSGRAGARLYRSGDVARRHDNGDLEFLGRVDNQVKIRGFRVELEEIAAALTSHQGVRESVVMASALASEQTSPSGKRLVAYVVGNPDEPSPGAYELRRFLHDRLPEYMVPTLFVSLKALPRTPNGKVDRKALPEPDAASPALDPDRIAPRSDTERTLAAIWTDLLGVAAIGMNDNFFELGGDSILSIQTVTRARRAGLRLTPRDLFEHQTLAALARVADEDRPKVALVPDRVTGDAPLTPIQRWFFEGNSPEPHHANMTLLLMLRRRLDPGHAREAVRLLVRQHDALRLRFDRAGDEFRQRHRPEDGSEPPFTRVDLSSMRDDGLAAAIEEQASLAQASFDLERDPLLRAVYFDLGADRAGRLLLIVHHLACDGVSLRILIEDFQTVYTQLSEGQAIDLPARTTPFIRWAEGLDQHAQSPALLAEMGYWREQVSEGSPPLPLDMKDGASANLAASERKVAVELDREETRQLVQEVPKAVGTRIDDIVLTALVETLAGWTGQPSVFIDMEGHGREDLLEGYDLSRTVGWFTTAFPARLTIDPDSRPGAAIAAVKEQLRRVPNRGIGYGLLRYLCADPSIREELRRSPQPGINYNYLGRFDQALTASSLFEIASESAGPDFSPQMPRRHLLEVVAVIVGESLRVEWVYSERCHHRSTVQELARGFIAKLRSLIAHCLEDGAGLSAADLAEFGWTGNDGDRITAAIARARPHGAGGESAWQELYPCSPMQEGLIFHSAYAPRSAAYNEQFLCALEGDVDIHAFEQAWQRVAERHAVLRTSFVWEDLPTAVQVVERRVSLPLARHDLRELKAAARAGRWRTVVESDRDRAFDLNQPPLMRLSLARFGDDAYRFAWTFHHSLLDGWSTFQLLGEVFALAEALRDGRVGELADRRPYRDYIAWLRQQDPVRAERFWSERLKGFRTPTPLVVDRPPSAVTEGVSGCSVEQTSLSEATLAALRSLARRSHLTLNSLVQGAWALLLSRYSGEADVVFGVTMAGRPADLPGVESMIGLFINTLPFRVEVTPQTELVPWLRGLQAQRAELLQYEHSPLPKVQTWSEVRGGRALFDSIFMFENYRKDASVEDMGRGFGVHDVAWVEDMSYPIAVVVVPERELLVRLVYQRQRLDAATVKRLLGHFVTLLTGMVESPSARVGDLPLLTPAEQRGLLIDRNETRRRVPKTAVHELVECVAKRSPERLAVSAGDRRLSYGELNRRANRLASFLRSRGVGPESVVAVQLQRSTELIVVILAVLKSGAAYLPLDPMSPPDRLAYMLGDSGASILVCRDAPPQLGDLRTGIVSLATDGETIERQSDQNPPRSVTPDNLAYVIYTSGSTGRPKGVEITHRGLANLVSWHCHEYRVTEEDRATQIAAPSFDASVWEVWPYLSAGASLHIPDDGVTASPPDLLRWLGANTISISFLPTPLAEEVLAEPIPEGLSLRTLLTGGDRLRAAPPSGLPFRVANNYGPTENTVVTTSVFLATEPPVDTGPPPIGGPISNTRVYVLDRWLQSVPIGVGGELYIGGDGLARGYRGLPGLTAERFIPDPFGAEPGSRLYRTGDRVRHRSDGGLDFLGRTDDQVKVRGFRIEPAEIARSVARHPLVRQAVVVAREGAGGTMRLVAYLVVEEGAAAPAAGALRDFLRAELPEYMIPAVFVTMDELPLTRHGKIDQRALPPPAPARPDIEESYIAPRTDTERVLAGILAAVLDVDEVGVDDNFFDLGGDSIISLRFVAKARQAGIPLSPEDLFRHQTVALLAAVVDTVRVAPPSQKWPVSGPVPLTPIQHWFFELDIPDRKHWNMAMLLEAPEGLDSDAMERAVAELIRRHDALRLRFVDGDEGWQQELVPRAVADDLPVPFERVSVAGHQGEVDAAIADKAAIVHRSLSLSGGPLIRVCHFDRGAGGPGRLLIVVHHLVADAFSLRVLIEDLSTEYRRLLSDGSVGLPATTSSFATWAKRLAERGQSAEIQGQVPFWLDPGREGGLQIPVDDARGDNRVASSRTVVAALEPGTTRALLQEVPKAYHTEINDALLAGLALTFSSRIGPGALLVDLEGHGREPVFKDLDVSRTVGWFTTMFPVLLDIPPTGSIGLALRATKERLRQIPNRGLDYGVLRYLGDGDAARRLRALPKAPIGFNYLGRYGESSDTPLFRWTRESSGQPIGPAGTRSHLLQVTALVVEGRLHTEWEYSAGIHRQKTVEALAEGYLDALRAIIQHCRSVDGAGYTPSDFPEAGLSQDQLDRFIQRLRRPERPGRAEG